MLQVRLKVLQLTAAVLQQQRVQPDMQQLLQQQAAAPLAGIIISCSLAAAEAEAAAGGRGSKAVRHAAVQVLQAVVRALGPGPLLAFFLPGLAGGLAKQLLAAGAALLALLRPASGGSSRGAVRMLDGAQQ